MPMTLDETPLVAWPPQPPAVNSPAPRRTWWRRPRFLVAVVLAGLAGGGLWWHQAVTAEPGLEWNGAALNVFRPGDDKTGVTDVHNLVGDEASVAFEPGGRFSAWMSLYNGGPRGVTIRSFPRERFHYWGVERVAVSKADNDVFPEGDGHAGPFHLDARETRYVRVDFRMADCDPAGLQNGKSFITSLPVTYRVLGITRTVSVPFDDAAIAVATMGVCDRPLN